LQYFRNLFLKEKKFNTFRNQLLKQINSHVIFEGTDDLLCNSHKIKSLLQKPPNTRFTNIFLTYHLPTKVSETTPTQLHKRQTMLNLLNFTKIYPH